MKLSQNRLPHLAAISLGAAHPDAHLAAQQLATAEAILRTVGGCDELPPAVTERLEKFDPRQLDVAAEVKALMLLGASEKRKLVELVAKVHDSDDIWDFAEDDYLRRVAKACGLREADYADLAVGDITLEDIGPVLLPPPLPE